MEFTNLEVSFQLFSPLGMCLCWWTPRTLVGEYSQLRLICDTEVDRFAVMYKSMFQNYLSIFIELINCGLLSTIPLEVLYSVDIWHLIQTFLIDILLHDFDLGLLMRVFTRNDRLAHYLIFSLT